MPSIKDFSVRELLGEGGFARVYRAKVIRNGQEVAIKMIEKRLICKNNLRSRVQKEFEIHGQLKHPSIVEVYSFFEDEKYVYLVMEICKDGPLQSYINEYGRVSESKARKLLKQIVDGLIYLHSHKIVHRDLTLANILRVNNEDVKIADFGLATKIESGSSHKTMCGTPNFMSPEVVTREPQSLESDVWSVGCMLYTLLVGRAPFHTREVRSTLDRVVHCKYDLPTDLSREAADLISAMLRIKPEERIPLDSILTHSFMSENISSSRPPSFVNDSGIDSVTSSHFLSGCDRKSLSNSTSAHRSIDSDTRRPRSHSVTANPPIRNRHSNSLSPTVRNNRYQITASSSQTNHIKQPPLTPITTDRLRPLRQRFSRCIVSILADGNVCLEVVKPRKQLEMVVEVMRIEPHTRRILIYEPNKGRGSPPLSDHPIDVNTDAIVHTYSLDTLPDNKRKSYLYAAQLVNVVKKKTAKITIYTDRGKCILMETGQDSQLFLHQGDVRVDYSSCSGETKIMEGEECVVTSSDKSLHCLSENHQELMQYTIKCHQFCQKVESILMDLFSNCDIQSGFPVILGSRPPPKYRPANNEIQSLISGPISGASELVSHPNSYYSVTSAPSQCNQRISPTSHQLPYPPHSNQRRASFSNIEMPLTESSLSSAPNPADKKISVFVQNVGWATKLSETSLRINFNDGTILYVDYNQNGVEKIVFTNGNGVSRNYDSQHAIPHEVKDKLLCFDKVVKAFREQRL